MRLAEFIPRNMEAILVEWEEFAATLLPAATDMTTLALRDHAKQILDAVVADLSASQSRQEQTDKSKGRAVKPAGAPETAAETHAVLRAKSGFDINQLAAEYRALRATVLRRWMDACRPDGPNVDDIVRFNEAVDQAVAESIGFYSTYVDQARNLLLGVLSHDMRSPLGTIQATAAYLTALNAGEKVSAAAARLIRSGASMKALLDDIMDFNRTRLGLGINIRPADADLEALFADELEQLRGANPGRHLELAVAGDTRGWWDGQRLQQVLRNLVTNAIKYGAADEPVRVALTGEGADVRFEVANRGSEIKQADLDRIFDPLVRGHGEADGGNADGLGLGLFIVREVALGHGGRVVARIGGGETVFEVRMPRRHERVPT